jgi:thioredoxin
MNKLNILLIAVSFLMSCSGATKTKENNERDTAKGEVIVLNKADFLAKIFDYEKNPETWVYEGNKPCIIDFYADWCGPCKKVSPILQDLASVYKEDIVVYKVNVDDEGELAAVFGIQSIPSLLFVPVNGEPKMSVGALGREALVSQIDNFLLSKVAAK